MTPAQILAMEELAAIAVTNAIKLYNNLRDNNPTLRPVAEIVADANATADRVIAKADEQIAEAQSKIGTAEGSGA